MLARLPRKVIRVSPPLPVPALKIRPLVAASFSVPLVEARVTSSAAVPASTSASEMRLPLAVEKTSTLPSTSLCVAGSTSTGASLTAEIVTAIVPLTEYAPPEPYCRGRWW